MEGDPEARFDDPESIDDDDIDLLGDPDDVDESVEEQIDEQLEDEPAEDEDL